MRSTALGHNGYALEVPEGYFIRKHASQFPKTKENEIFIDDLEVLHNAIKPYGSREKIELVDAFVMFNPSKRTAIAFATLEMFHYNRFFTKEDLDVVELHINGNHALMWQQRYDFRDRKHKVWECAILGKKDEVFSFLTWSEDNSLESAREEMELALSHLKIY